MTTIYYGLTDYGLWIWFKSKKAVRNCKEASKITKENIIEFRQAPLYFQIFRFCLQKDYKRG